MAVNQIKPFFTIVQICRKARFGDIGDAARARPHTSDMSPRSINRHLTLRLRQLRNRAGLTQAELAAELNVNRKTVSHYETGERTPDVHMIAALARFFRVSADYLLGLTDVPLPTTEILHLLALQNQQAERPLRVAEDE